MISTQKGYSNLKIIEKIDKEKLQIFDKRPEIKEIMIKL